MAKSENFYKIPAFVLYGSPVYIHSHETSLQHSMTDQSIAAAHTVRSTVKEVTKVIDEIKKSLDVTINLLTTETNKLINAGYPIERDGRPAGLTDRYKKIGQEILKSRKRIMDLQNNKKISKYNYLSEADKKAMEELVDLSLSGKAKEKLVQDFANSSEWKGKLTDLFMERIAKSLSAAALRKTKTNNNRIFTAEDVAKLTLNEFVKYFHLTKKNRDTKLRSLKSNIKKQIDSALAEFNSLINNLKKYMPILNNLNNLSHSTVQDPNLLSLLNLIGGNSQILPKLGYLTELAGIFGDLYSGEGMEVGVVVPGSTGYVMKESVGTKKNIAGGDSVTTDILNTLEKGEAVFKWGTSMKLNPRYLDKRAVNVNNVENSLPSLRGYNDLTKSRDNRELLYYLLNYEALTIARYSWLTPETFEKTKDSEFAESIQPKSGPLHGLVDFLGELQQSLMIYSFIVALVGDFFTPYSSTPDSLESIRNAQGLPIILQTPTGQYWTKDILIKLKEMIVLCSNNPSLAKSFFSNSIFNKTNSNDSTIESLLKDLYVAKVEDFWTGKKNSRKKSRYSQLYENEKIKNILSQLEGLLIEKIGGKDIIEKMLSSKWYIKFDLSTLY